MGNIIVIKVGGTTAGAPGKEEEYVLPMAEKAVAEKKAGNCPIIIMSAQKGETNRYGKIAQTLSKGRKPGDEFAALVSAGESISSAMMALAIEGMGVPSRSFRAWQTHKDEPEHVDEHLIVTNAQSVEAEIEGIRGDILHSYLKGGGIPVIAGFQGYSPELGRITILKRNQSDLTAALVAVAVGAARCDFYTDVPKICSEDPRENPEAVRYDHLSAKDMGAIVGLGRNDRNNGSVSAIDAFNNKVSCVIDPKAVEALLEAGIMGQSLSAAADIPIGSEFPGTTFGEGETRVHGETGRVLIVNPGPGEEAMPA